MACISHHLARRSACGSRDTKYCHTRKMRAAGGRTAAVANWRTPSRSVRRRCSRCCIIPSAMMDRSREQRLNNLHRVTCYGGTTRKRLWCSWQEAPFHGVIRMKSTCLSIAVLLISAIVAAAQPTGPKIIGGSEIGRNEFPFAAWVKIRVGRDRPNCTGSVIAPRWVLTAAHCLEAEGGEILPAFFFKFWWAATFPKQCPTSSKGSSSILTIAIR